MGWADILLTVLILTGVILAIWARISKQTIPDLVRELLDIAREQKEETFEPYLN